MGHILDLVKCRQQAAHILLFLSGIQNIKVAYIVAAAHQIILIGLGVQRLQITNRRFLMLLFPQAMEITVGIHRPQGFLAAFNSMQQLIDKLVEAGVLQKNEAAK